MAKTQYYTATTIDGFIADEHNSLDWLFEADDGRDSPFTSFFEQVGAFAMGATTYEWVYAHERLGEQPQKWAEYYGDVPSWVFTHRSLPPLTGSTVHFVRGDVRPVHDAMRRAAGDRNIWIVGGGELAGQFYDHGLLDELIVQVAPVTLGGGAPLFPRAITTPPLRLVSVTPCGEAFAELRYEVPRFQAG